MRNFGCKEKTITSSLLYCDLSTKYNTRQLGIELEVDCSIKLNTYVSTEDFQRF